MKRFSLPLIIGLLAVFAYIGLCGIVLIWVCLPAVTGLVFSQPITIVSVPFIDYNGTPLDLTTVVIAIGTVRVLLAVSVLVACKRRSK